jgi:PhzF family phenazine biosynthesis protein
MRLQLFQIDAFSSSVFSGNPAAVVPLDAWLPDATLQAIAVENNLSETAFFVSADPGGDADFDLRWFTPAMEVDLCGHATLASAHVLVSHLGFGRETVTFATKSGLVSVSHGDGRLALDFPARPGDPLPVSAQLSKALGAEPVEVRLARDLMAVYATEEQVRALAPDFAGVRELEALGVIVTAPGEAPDVDFVSRFFAPRAGIDEDPVTGSAHCTLAPYWAERLGKTDLHALQVSERGGELFCSYEPGADRVHIAGSAVSYLEGTIAI